jgi:hypothetical protein
VRAHYFPANNPTHGSECKQNNGCWINQTSGIRILIFDASISTSGKELAVALALNPIGTGIRRLLISIPSSLGKV